MKRFLALLCVSMLLCGSVAVAEIHTITDWLTGESYEVEMETYESTLGFSLCYNPMDYALSETQADLIESIEFDNVFFTVQSFTQYSEEELIEGLLLQNDLDDILENVNIATLGGEHGDEFETKMIGLQEMIDGEEYLHQFYVIDRDEDVLLYELQYPMTDMPDNMALEIQVFYTSFTLE